MEEARLSRFSYRPSRMDAAIVFLLREEALRYPRAIPDFAHHSLYRVTLCDPSAGFHISDARFGAPQGMVRSHWADVYWMDFEAQH